MPAPYLPDMVVVQWLDITSSNNGWFSLEEVEKLTPALCYTPGWIVKEDQNYLYVASAVATHEGEVDYSFDTVIPKGVVKKIIKIKTKWR